MMIKQHNIYLSFLLALSLLHNSTQWPQLHAATDLEIAEGIAACGYLPATIIELATENKSEKVQLQGKVTADALRFTHTALATINHWQGGFRTNKYNLFWLAAHGYNLVKNTHSLATLKPTPPTAQNKEAKDSDFHKKLTPMPWKDKLVPAARILTSCGETAAALAKYHQIYTIVHEHYDYQNNTDNIYSLSYTGLLSDAQCINKALTEKDAKKRIAWLLGLLVPPIDKIQVAYAQPPARNVFWENPFWDHPQPAAPAPVRYQWDEPPAPARNVFWENPFWDHPQPAAPAPVGHQWDELMAAVNELDENLRYRLAQDSARLERARRERLRYEQEDLLAKAPSRPNAKQAVFANRATDPKEDCPICMCPLGANVIRLMPCGHDLHPECKRDLHNAGRQDCPGCRENITN